MTFFSEKKVFQQGRMREIMIYHTTYVILVFSSYFGFLTIILKGIDSRVK